MAFAKINLRENMIDDPQVRAMKALVEFEHPVGSAMRRAWENTRARFVMARTKLRKFR